MSIPVGVETDEFAQGQVAASGSTGARVGAVDSIVRSWRIRAALVAGAPVVLLAGFLYHPHIADLTDSAAVAAAVVADPTRWGIAHMLVGIGAGLVLLAFLALRALLRERGEERWSAFGVPFVVIGCTLFAMLPAMEFSVLAAAEAGMDVQAIQDALAGWFVPTLMAGALVFGIGALAFAAAIARSRLLDGRLAVLVVAALVVMAVARFVPLGFVQFHIGGLAGVVAFWPIAARLWRQATEAVEVTRS